MSADVDLLLAQTRARLDKLTRPTFEREVVEALLAEIDCLNSKPTWSVDDLPADDDADIIDLDDGDPDRPNVKRMSRADLEEAVEELRDDCDGYCDRLDNLNRLLNNQSAHVNQLEQALHEACGQVHAYAMQLQWFVDAAPEAREARLAYLREMRERLTPADLPQDSAIISR